MPSPFPGMDPFLEVPGTWKWVHSCFPLAALQLLQSDLPERYYCTPEVDVYIHEPSSEERRRFAEVDAGVGLFASGGTTGGSPVAAASTLAPPVRRRLSDVFEETHRWVEVRTFAGDEVVTVIELLSPTNKIRHRDAYEQKRRALLDSDAHLVEIDLLRAGERLPVEDLPPSDYLVSVSRAEDRPIVDLWPINLRDPLPVVPIPLRDGESVTLDLRALLDSIWSVSRFEDRIYRHPPDPPLTPENAAWAAGVLTAAGLPLPPNFPESRPAADA